MLGSVTLCLLSFVTHKKAAALVAQGKVVEKHTPANLSLSSKSILLNHLPLRYWSSSSFSFEAVKRQAAALHGTVTNNRWTYQSPTEADVQQALQIALNWYGLDPRVVDIVATYVGRGLLHHDCTDTLP